jgi:hypothetical protein
MENEKEKELKEDIQKYSDIEAVALSHGGKRIIAGLKKDVFNLISAAGSAAKNGASYNELVGINIALDEKINMLNMFTNSSENKKDANKLFEELMKLENPELEPKE